MSYRDLSELLYAGAPLMRYVTHLPAPSNDWDLPNALSRADIFIRTSFSASAPTVTTYTDVYGYHESQTAYQLIRALYEYYRATGRRETSSYLLSLWLPMIHDASMMTTMADLRGGRVHRYAEGGMRWP